MAQKPTPKTYKIGDPMSAGAFRKYIEHFHNGNLREAKIERPTFFAVAHALLSTGDFKTGERFRLSQVAIADISGLSRASVRKVLSLLEKTGAIREVDISKRRGGGMPVKVYTLTYSEHVHRVLTTEDRNAGREEWKREDRGTGKHKPSALVTTSPINGKHKPSQWEPQAHNRNLKEQEKNHSESFDSSPTPPALSPTARAGVAVSMDDLLADQLDVEVAQPVRLVQAQLEIQPDMDWTQALSHEELTLLGDL